MTDHPRVGIGVIIQKEGRILLVRRRGTHGGGEWAPPGGHLELGESPEECAIRETKEEVGLSIVNVRFIGLTNDFFRESGVHYVTVWMEGRNEDDSPSISAPDEIDEVKWFPLDDLPEPLFLPLLNLLRGRCYSP